MEKEGKNFCDDPEVLQGFEPLMVEDHSDKDNAPTNAPKYESYHKGFEGFVQGPRFNEDFQ
jgi:hypothetical protein